MCAPRSRRGVISGRGGRVLCLNSVRVVMRGRWSLIGNDIASRCTVTIQVVLCISARQIKIPTINSLCQQQNWIRHFDEKYNKLSLVFHQHDNPQLPLLHMFWIIQNMHGRSKSYLWISLIGLLDRHETLKDGD